LTPQERAKFPNIVACTAGILPAPARTTGILSASARTAGILPASQCRRNGGGTFS